MCTGISCSAATTMRRRNRTFANYWGSVNGPQAARVAGRPGCGAARAPACWAPFCPAADRTLRRRLNRPRESEPEGCRKRRYICHDHSPPVVFCPDRDLAFCGNRIWRTDGTHWISWHSKGAIDGHGTFRTHVALHRPAFDEKARLPSPADDLQRPDRRISARTLAAARVQPFRGAANRNSVCANSKWFDRRSLRIR